MTPRCSDATDFMRREKSSGPQAVRSTSLRRSNDYGLKPVAW
jgi:hypothetical protein